MQRLGAQLQRCTVTKPLGHLHVYLGGEASPRLNIDRNKAIGYLKKRVFLEAVISNVELDPYNFTDVLRGLTHTEIVQILMPKSHFFRFYMNPSSMFAP